MIPITPKRQLLKIFPKISCYPHTGSGTYASFASFVVEGFDYGNYADTHYHIWYCDNEAEARKLEWDFCKERMLEKLEL